MNRLKEEESMKNHDHVMSQRHASSMLAWLGLGVFLATISCCTPAPRDAGSEPSKVFRNADGSVNGMLERSRRRALFVLDPDANALVAFKEWIRANSAALALDPIDDVSVLDGLRPASRPLSVFGALRVHHFEQTYRGFEVSGPERRLSLSVVPGRSNARAVGFTGTILDSRIDYAGLDERRLPPERAEGLIRETWRSLLFEGGPTPTHDDDVGEVALVAVPALRALAYRGEILRERQPLAAVVIHAVSGEYVGYDLFAHNDPFDHHPITVVAHQMWNNPDAEGVLQPFVGLGGSSFGPCAPLPPSSVGCLLRMGNDRAAVYDFRHDNNATPTIWLAPQFSAPSLNAFWSFFTGFPTEPPSVLEDKLHTQNAFQKMSAALDAVDPLKSASGWDHHPDAPFGPFTPASLSLWTNIDHAPMGDPCGDNLGMFWEIPHAAFWSLVEHPYPTSQFPTPTIRLCTKNEVTLFHELGHYYDMYSTYGTMGTGLLTNSCTWDTPDESIPLRETVGDVVMLYLYRKLYTGLPHTLGTTNTPCTFQAFSGVIPVHTGACPALGQSIYQFVDDRPAATTNSPCLPTTGYRMGSIWQAVWKSVNGMSCNTLAPYDCATITPFESDTVMEALLYALTLSNLQSYEQFFENVWFFVDFQAGTVTGNMFRQNMTDHGILDAL